MKKILALAALMGVASLSYGQGLVSFANQTTTKISTNGATIAVSPIGTWYFALFKAPSTKNTVSASLDPLSDGWTLVAIGTNTATAGRLLGNTTTEGVATTPSGGSTDDYAVAGWSGNLGVTWASVEQAFGNNSSMVASNYTGGSQSLPGWFAIAPTVGNDVISQPSGSSINSVFSSAGGVTGFGLSLFTPVATPEPASVALLGLGSAALMIFRRRK